MDTAVNEHASVLGCISYKKASVIDEIACLRSNDKRITDCITCNLSLGVSITGIESSREARHDFEMRIFVGNFDNSLGLYVLIKG